jgi:hypothetical protein
MQGVVAEHVREVTERTPRIYDALFPFFLMNFGDDDDGDEQNSAELHRKPEIGAKPASQMARNRREQFRHHQNLLRRIMGAGVAAPFEGRSRPQSNEEAGEDDASWGAESRKRKKRPWDAHSAAAVRLLPTPYALETVAKRYLSDLNTRVRHVFILIITQCPLMRVGRPCLCRWD